MKKSIFLFFPCFIFFSDNIQLEQGTNDTDSLAFRLGCEVLLENTSFLKGANIGIITNQTGITSDGRHIVDELVSRGLKVLRIFSPEHGIRGDESYPDRDQITGIPVISLYGGKNKPSSEDLRGLDVLIYDIQDVGARFYTYTTTLLYCMEAAIENDVRFIVCDRPVVINPDYVDGFVLEEKFSSFVGSVPVPVCYGMTSGELALYLNHAVLKNSLKLEVMEMKGYSRSADYTELGMKWVKPSPSMFYPSSALCYPATCFLEGTNVSEGRGTDRPFEYVGAPWVNGQVLAERMNSYRLVGVEFKSITFKPSEKISAYPPKFLGTDCNGIFIYVTDRQKFEAVKCGVILIHSLYNLFPEFKFTQNNFIDKLAGTDRLRKALINGKYPDEVIAMWREEVERFKVEREKFLIYR